MKKYLLVFSIMLIFTVGSMMAVTITVAPPDAQSFNYLQSVIPVFEKQNPDITVQVVAQPNGSQIAALVAAGNAPNIFVGPVSMNYVQNGLLLDFTKMPGYNQIASELITGVFPYNGGVYNIPWMVTTQVMFYNKAIFKLAGLNPDDPPQTFAQYLYDAKKISELQPGPYGKYYGQFFWNEELSFSWYWGMLEQIYYNFNDAKYPHLIGQYGLSLDFTNPNAHFVDFLKFCKAVQQYSSSGMQQASIFGRNVGMWLQFAYGWTFNLQNSTGGPMVYGKDYGLAPIPTNSDSATAIHWSTLAQRPLIVFKTTPQQDMASWKFIQFLMEPQNELQACEEIGWLTSVKENANNPFFSRPDVKPYVDQLAHVVVTNPFDENTAVTQAVLNAWGQYVVSNSIPTAEQAFQTAAKNAQSALNSSGL
ncbi:MAG: extracellular solute-binding protein [Thermotogae bacterium]|nr:extracellular solute-binding protein [Thermotogota bacterium]MCL5032725.1 extracellular solute-binding protein [Thermotogota bacterium]